MPCFLVATVNVTDAVPFAAYGKAVAGLSEQFGGETIVKGPVSAVVEGESPTGERVVIVRFETEREARAYVESDQYRYAKSLRVGAGSVDMRLVNA